MKEIKEQLYGFCQRWVDDRIAMAQGNIQAAQAAANEETKSSAGDKYETARAMAQLEIEKAAAILAEAGKQKQLLGKISTGAKTSTVQLGSLAHTNHGWFYISLSAGMAEIDRVAYLCLSPVSPLGQAMMGLQQGGRFSFNQRHYMVKAVY